MSCLFMFYFGLNMFFMLKKHVLMLLLTLEFLVLTILLMLLNFLMNFMFDGMILIYFIIVMVCEGVMGLVLLTLLVRSHGSDYTKSLMVFSC
uniref:NADH-ubiquinone oxidoreductase chain 4L n=1 Tax=Diaphorina lycii TaxID=2047824 RepID=A0A343M3B3_9HEMI|nr:NADH dehydrogenase subunit 4L [Diaphorina lycii]ATR80192.1 NADH dehydrogenase subunit 4L [Diaphorina lycii]